MGEQRKNRPNGKIDENELKDIAFDDEVITYSKEKIYKIFDDENIRQVLTVWGIPRSVSPYIDFFRDGDCGFEKFSVFMERHSLGYKDEKDNSPDTRRYEDYIVFASHEENCYLMLNENLQVVFVDDERMTECYVNKDFHTFMSIIIYFNKMIIRLIDENPEQDVQDSVTNEDVDLLFAYVEEMDKDAAEDDSFWRILIENFLELDY